GNEAVERGKGALAEQVVEGLVAAAARRDAVPYRLDEPAADQELGIVAEVRAGPVGDRFAGADVVGAAELVLVVALEEVAHLLGHALQGTAKRLIHLSVLTGSGSSCPSPAA